VKYNTIVDFSSLHVFLTLGFIGDVTYGTDLHALPQGSDCRMLQLFEIILPEVTRCGLFPLRGKFAVLQKTRNMYRAIAELRGMAEKAMENARRREATPREECGKNSSNKIFEILAEYALS
jgi:cholesterol 24(S)-hydroxylase